MEGTGKVDTASRAHAAGAALAVLLALAVSACGGGSKQVAAAPGKSDKTALDGSSEESGCKSADDCPPVAPDISATFAPSGALIGFVGEPVNWEFYGVDTNTMNPDATSSERRVMVLLDKVPPEAQILPGKEDKLDSHVRIDWTPQKVYTGKTMDIVLRDYDRCLVDGDEDCDAYAMKDKYDTKQSVPWEIADRAVLEQQLAGGQPNVGNVVNVSNSNCGPTPTSQGQITTSLFTTGLGVLLNPKAALPGLLGAMMQGGLGGGGSTPPAPTPC